MAHAAAQSLQTRYLSIAGIAVAAMAIANTAGEARAESLASVPMLHFPGQAKAQKQETPACPGGICPGLANVFYLPEQNAETMPKGGAVMFTNRKLGECAAFYSTERGQRTFVTADSMRDFISKTMANFNLSGDYKTGELTVTRAALLKDINKTTLDAFIDSAASSNEAVRSVFTPVWRILIDLYSVKCAKAGKGSKECGYLQRAVNLQAAYEGWVAIGCTKEVDGRQQTWQRMAVEGTTTLGINTYQCLVSKTGCRSNDDCHIGGAGSVCYCYGQGCIDTGPQVSGTPLFRDKVRGSQSGSYNEGVNNSCYYKFGGYCNCDTGWAGGLPDRTIYRQSSQP